MNEQRRSPVSGAARGTTLLVTNLIKLAGVVVAVNEAFTTRDAVVLATAAFMMAGAQASENVLLAVLDRILRAPPVDP